MAILTGDGVGAMTMERVAETAGVAKGSVYNYFPSKHALAVFVFTRTLEPLREAVDAIVQRQMEAVDKLRLVLRTWFDYVNTHRGFVNILFNDPAFHRLIEMVDPPPRDDLIRKLASVIRQGVDDGVLRRIDPLESARLLFVAASDTCCEHIAGREVWPVEQSVEFIMDSFLHGAAK